MLLSAGMFTTWVLVFWLFPVSRTVESRTVSPTGKFTAIVEKVESAHASKSSFYVYVEQQSVLTNRPLVASFFETKRGDQTGGINIDWIRPDVLRLKYQSAEQISVPKKVIQCGNEVIHVEVEEQPK